MDDSIAEYLHALKIRIIPVHTDTIGAPEIRVAAPSDWLEIGEDVLPGAYAAWADLPGDGHPEWADNLLVMVGRITERIDPAQLIGRGFVDSRRLPDWTEQSADFVDCDGYRSAVISGLYTGGGLRVITRTQYLVIDSLDHDYLVQYTLTVAADSMTSGLFDGPPPLQVAWPSRGGQY